MNEPRIVAASDVNSEYFTLNKSDFDSYEAIQIRRVINSNNIEKDLWNDDGNPPTVLFTIVNPVIYFRTNCVEIIGFEVPNLMVAGILSEPYDAVIKPISKLVIDKRRYVDIKEMKNVYPQRIILF